MDKIFEKTMELAHLLQDDPRCQAVLEAQRAADADENLQKLIGEFNLKRLAINAEESKSGEEQDAEKLREMNEELRSIYTSVMANDKMLVFNQAHTEMDELINKIQLAINLAVQGQDPEMALEQSSCGGNCSSCGGCH